MRRFAFIALAAMLAATTAAAQGTIVGSKHDLSIVGGGSIPSAYGTQVCVYCHTPHKASTDAALWNKALPSPGSFTAVGGGVQEYFNVAASGSCLSCHDGTLGVDVVVNVNGAAGAWTAGAGGANFTTDWKMTAANPGYIGTDLSNDHPIGVDYSTSTTNTRFNPMVIGGHSGAYVRMPGSTATRGLTLYTRTGAATSYTVECSSCHTPHDPTNTLFLRYPNTGSGVCLACHKK